MKVRLSNRQSEVPVPLARLRRQLKAALPLIPRPLPSTLRDLSCVLVSSQEMSRVHALSLNDPAPTDVITFPYGEIVICPAVARDSAPYYRLEVPEEILLYALHGLLHLAGYDDVDQASRRTMHRVQESWLKSVLKAVPG